MIKKLRNKMLMMNMISIFCVIVMAFTAIYAVTYSRVEEKIEQSLFRTLSFQRPMRMPQQQEGMPPRGNQGASPERELRDSRNFSVFVDEEGNAHTDSLFGQNSEHYEEVTAVALAQNTDSGEFESEGIFWRFITRELKNNSKIIALVDVSAEKNFLRQLIITFLIGTLVLWVLVFLISLHFANRAVKPVEDAWEKQKQFVADASHELKTPLTAINANIDVLLSKPDETLASQEKWLQYIKSEAAHLSQLSSDLLLLARIDAGAEGKKENTLISEIVEADLLGMEAVAFEKGVTLEYDIEKGIKGNVNVMQIRRLCHILLDNAIKYSPKGDCVTVKFSRQGRDQAVLCVHNMGEAIKKEDIGKIFDRFYRADESRSTTGYGLGLSMAKEIVSMHGGKITVKSTQEDGTLFTVSLSL